MTTVYKLLRTLNSYQWVLGEKRTASGKRPLYSPGWLHAYTDPLLAVMLNPIHDAINDPILFRGEAVIGATDRGLKVDCLELTLIEEIPLPIVTTEQHVRFGILCALEVYADPRFVAWAQRWIRGEDRSTKKVEAATWAAEMLATQAVEMQAPWAAWAAAQWAAHKVADPSAWGAAWAAARQSAWAAEAAARGAKKDIDLPALAKKAVEDSP